jgi:hypothetical protein
MTKRFLALVVTVALVMVLFIPSSLAYFTIWIYTENGGSLNARLTPSYGDNVAFQIPYGEEVTVEYHLGNGWTRLMAAGAYECVYVQTRYLVASQPGPRPTPHGGGGPGDGPVGVRAGLEALLPNPQVKKDAGGKFYMECDDKSAGYVSNFLGNFGVLLRAYTYILTLGRENVKMVGPLAVLNANYVKESLKDDYYLPIEGICKHEFVFDGLADKSTGVTTLDIAKRLLDYGYHAPTIYFPLLFHQSIMIEPTETESKETLDEFIAVMKKVAKEAIENPDIVKSAPHSTPVRRLDETTAARFPKTTYRQLKG